MYTMKQHRNQSSEKKSVNNESCNTSNKHQPHSFSLNNLINGFFPPTFYNHKTKKIFGIMSAEDLLLIALILLFSENEENNDPLTVIALIYILLSDYIELPDFLI